MHPAFFLVYIFPTRRAMKILLALGATTGVHAPLAASLRPRAVVTQLRRVEVGTCSVTIRPAGYSSVYSRDITGTCTGYRPTNRSVEEFHRVCYVRCRPRWPCIVAASQWNRSRSPFPRPSFLSSPISSNIPPSFSPSITIHIHIERFIVLYRASDANATTRRRFLCKYLFARPLSFVDILSLSSSFSRTAMRACRRRISGLSAVNSSARRKVVFYVPFNIHRDCIYSIFRATCAEAGIICLHRSIEIYGSVFRAVIGRRGMEFCHGRSKSRQKTTANRPIIDLISALTKG